MHNSANLVPIPSLVGSDWFSKIPFGSTLLLVGLCACSTPPTEETRSPAPLPASPSEPDTQPVSTIKPSVSSPPDTEAPQTSLQPQESRLRAPPEGFVNLKERIQGLQIDVRYHGSDNFTGAPLPGYGAPGAWLLEEAAEALKHVQADLEPQGYGLLVYDAYRPKRGTRGMVAWAERTDQLHLFKQGYIARHSGHNHGHTVDLTLVKLENGAAVDMGTPWDTLSSASHTRNATGAALDHRLLLKRAMEARGFAYYYKEWWHFSFPMEGTRPRDVPYGCFEAAEGAWTPLPEWNSVAFQMPTDWPDTPCPSDQPIK